MILEIGKTYDVTHSRQGKFKMKVTSLDSEFCTGVVTDGYTQTLLADNERGEGEEITIRISFCTFKESEK